MRDVVIIDSVRSAVGKRNGALSAMPATELLGDVLLGLLGRNDVDPADVGQDMPRVVAIDPCIGDGDPSI